MSGDLFPPPSLSREDFSSRRLSLVPVRGDALLPDLRDGRDYVLAAPTDKFLYDAMYVIEDAGVVLIYRVQSFGPGRVVLVRNNPNSRPHESDVLSRALFEEIVLGIVVCELKVKDPELMRAAYAGAAL
jgi:hypothetical protein